MGLRRLDGVKALYPLQVLFRGGGLQERVQPAYLPEFLLFPDPLSGLHGFLRRFPGFLHGPGQDEAQFRGFPHGFSFQPGSQFFGLISQYSSMSGNPAYSICGEVNFAKGLHPLFRVRRAGFLPVRVTRMPSLSGPGPSTFSLGFPIPGPDHLETQVPIVKRPQQSLYRRKRHQPVSGCVATDGLVREGPHTNPVHFYRLQYHQYPERLHLRPVESLEHQHAPTSTSGEGKRDGRTSITAHRPKL